METGKESRIVGIAEIINYEVSFDAVIYSILVKECSLETMDHIENLADYIIDITIPFTEEHKLMHWLNNPAFAAMKEAHQNEEKDCYFEHRLSDKAALMTLNGSVALIPVVNP